MRRVVRLLAVATGFAALLLPVAPAGATAKPTYIAIVISGQGSACVKWHSGITGDEVLNGVATVSYRRDGIILQIDGRPTTAKADDTHYWSYWHNSGGGWQYSNAGAGSTQPAAGTVEGWAYDNGSQNPPRPPSVSYAATCGSRDPKPAPPPVHRTTHRAAPPASHHATRSPAAQASTTYPAPGSPASSTASGRPTPRATRPAATHASGGVSAADPSVDASPVRGRGSLTPLAKPKPHDSAGTAGPVLAGVGLVVVIGAGAGWTALRRRRAT